MSRRTAVLLGALVALGACAPRGATGPAAGQPPPRPHTFVYVGTASGEIAVLELDLALGILTPRSRRSLGGAPAALAGDGDGRVLVAALDQGATAVSLQIDPVTGALAPRGSRATGGSQPARAVLDTSGKYALITHRSSANVSVLAIKPDLTLDAPELFPAGRGAYALAVHPSNEIAFVTNLRAGTLSQFSFNAGTGRLTPNGEGAGGLPWNAGPRQVVCHPSGRFTYVLDQSNETISVHAFDDRMRTLSHMAFQSISTLPEAAQRAASTTLVTAAPAGKSKDRDRDRGKDRDRAGRRPEAGDIRVHPSGRFLYASNATLEAVATFAIDGSTGGLTLLGHQQTGGTGTDDLAVDPAGKYLLAANHKSHSVTVFRLDERQGVPASLGTTATPGAPRALFITRPLLER
jgi:6-phosphogluconolactonase